MNSLKHKFSKTPLYHKLSLVKSFPAYMGMALPDTPFWARFYVLFSRFVNAREEKQRVALSKKIVQDNTPKGRISEEEGYGFFDFSDNPMVMEAVKCAKEYADLADWEVLEKVAKKHFLINLPIDYEDKKFAPIAKLINSPEVLAPLVTYFGSLPVIGDVDIWYSPNKDESNDRSRAYHSDGLDRRHIQVFFPLEEVDENNGPLTILPASKSEHVYKQLHKDGTVYRRNQKLSDEEVYKYASPEDAVKAVGKPGHAIMADTTRCYHYGSRSGNRPRMKLLLQYYEPFSKKMPLWNRTAQLGGFDEKVMSTLNKDVAQNVVGMAHLEFSRMRSDKAA